MNTNYVNYEPFCQELLVLAHARANISYPMLANQGCGGFRPSVAIYSLGLNKNSSNIQKIELYL